MPERGDLPPSLIAPNQYGKVTQVFYFYFSKWRRRPSLELLNLGPVCVVVPDPPRRAGCSLSP